MEHASRLILVLAAGLLASTTTANAAAHRQTQGAPRGEKSSAPDRVLPSPTYISPAPAGAAATITTVDPMPITVSVSPMMGGIAGTPAGTTVYSNEIDPITGYYSPGPRRCKGGTQPGQLCPPSACPGGACVPQRMAEDIQVAGGACDMVYYNLMVYGSANGTCPAGRTYDVHVELWDDEPCTSGAAVIPGTTANFAGIAICQGRVLEVNVSASPVPIPATVWMAASFSSADGGWIVAEQAETGFTGNFFSEDQLDGSQRQCGPFFALNNAYAGFWANILCNVTTPPSGACCDGNNCSETTEELCPAGNWKGAFTTCDPSPCLPGTCCRGFRFSDCSDTVESDCSDDDELFHPLTTCEATPCEASFRGYENLFNTEQFDAIGSGEKWGDDLKLRRGAVCDLEAYSIDVVNDAGTGPFSAQVALWTNDDGGSPEDDTDDVPLAVIAATQRDFIGLPGNRSVTRLLVGPFDGIVLPEKVWLVLTTDSVDAGPLLAGNASIGSSLDGFAIFNHEAFPNEWANGFFYGGFVPTECPGPQPGCVAAGSFRISLWCTGTAPTGACCNDGAGTCVDDVLEPQCDGRWAADATCAEAPFTPPCGASACCTIFGCEDRTAEDCAFFEGVSSPGDFCNDLGFTCPRFVCLNATGSCGSVHSTAGCSDPFCCEAVCSFDAECCNTQGNGWDQPCVDDVATQCATALPNDHCTDATAIAGTGVFPFDNTDATTDGPPHDACIFAGEDPQIANDVWYRWTSPCTNEVFIRTCGLTDVDTKLAVYQGSAGCPPTDADRITCDEDRCPFQSMVTFPAVSGGVYLLRVGTFPGGGGAPEAPGGAGQFSITCGPPNNPACPGGGNCCVPAGTASCNNELCCEAVCACDPFCCTTTWDDSCAQLGVGGTGCGAASLCPQLCPNCPSGTVSFVDPPDGVVDAREPNRFDNLVPAEGIDAVRVAAPVGAGPLGCWSLCESQAFGPPNSVSSVTDNGDGTYTVRFIRPITRGAVTTLTYEGTGTTGRFTFHPGNVTGDGFTNVADVQAMVNALSGTFTPPWGNYSLDINRTGLATSADLVWLVDVIQGGGAFAPGWNITALPTRGTCP